MCQMCLSLRFYCISDYVINIIGHVITFGGHNVADGITEQLKNCQSVPKAKETTVNKVVFEVKT